MSCFENMGSTFGRASIRVILIRPAISGYHWKNAGVSFLKMLIERDAAYVGQVLHEEVVELSRVLDSCRSSTNNDKGEKPVDLLLRLACKVGALDACKCRGRVQLRAPKSSESR